MEELPGMWEKSDLSDGWADTEHERKFKAAVCSNPNCMRPRQDFLMAFRDEPYCSDKCRKALGLDGVSTRQA